MVEIRHFQLVEAIGRLGTLKQAAEELHLTQSALSHQLKQLEESLGIRLFTRAQNKLHFTSSGREFCEASKEILQKIQEVRERLNENREDQMNAYIHGYTHTETQRLYDQAHSIADFLHWDSEWEEGSYILEAGCGVGAQTRIIAPRNPTCRFVGVDISQKSLGTAASLLEEQEIQNVELLQADLQALPFPDEHFEHVFVSFVLEHVPTPAQILQELFRVLKPQGTVTAIEGDHGSTFFYPSGSAAQKAVQAQVDLQQKTGGNANIGRELYPLLHRAGFLDIQVSPRQIYVDESKPELVKGFILETFTAMIKGVGEEVVANRLMTQREFEKGIQELEKTALSGGSFSYTFFKAVAKKES